MMNETALGALSASWRDCRVELARSEMAECACHGEITLHQATIY